MKPPRTLFSLGRPGAKPAATAVETGAEATPDASGTDTVVDTVEPVDSVEVVEPVEVVDAPDVVDAPEAGGPAEPAADELPAADAGEVAPDPVDDLAAVDEPDTPDTPVVEPVASVDDAAVAEPTVAEAAVEPEPEPEPEPAPEPAPEAAMVSDVDVSVEESGYLCGACDAPLPVGAAICAACGTPVAGAELYEDLAPAGQPDAVAEDVAAVDERATLAPAASAAFVPPVVDAGPAEVAQPAAVLYGEGSGVEPLPPTPEGSWGITQPSFGGVGDDLVDHPAEPAAEVAAAGVAGAATYGATNAWAGAPATATTVPVGPATSPGYGGADASSMPYGTGAVTTSEKSGSKAPIWIAAAVVVVLIGLIGGIMIAGSGSKSDDGNGAAAPTTTKAGVTTSVATTVKPTTPTTAAATTPSTAATTSPTTAPTTDTTAAPTSTETPSTVASTASTAATVVVTTVATTAPRQTTIITSPPTVPTTIAPGSISPSQPNGAELRIPKGGRTSITFTNTGGRPASCAISVGSGNLSLDRNCSPSIAAGSSVTINITANPGFEGAGSISGLLEGVGSYTVPIFVKNG